MTPEDWKKVEALEDSYAGAARKLIIDGYAITIQRERFNKTLDCFVVYVNGEWKGKWLQTDCEERRRFFRRIDRKLFNGARRARLQKEAKSRNKYTREYAQKLLDKDWSYYLPYWTSIRSLKRHLIANNTSIELVKE
jgi:hypothetical protein